jgi:hypothetical protein
MVKSQTDEEHFSLLLMAFGLVPAQSASFPIQLVARKSNKCCCEDIHFYALLQDFFNYMPVFREY